MRRAGGPLLAILLLVTGAVPGFSGLITFDEGLGSVTVGYGPDPYWSGVPNTKGTILTNEYAGVGVLFTSDSNGVAFVTDHTYSPGLPTLDVSDPDLLAVNTLPPNTGTDMTLTLTFVDPNNIVVPGWVEGSTISFVLEDTEANVTIRSYDLNGILLETLTLSSSSITTLSFTSGMVHTVVFTDTGADGFGMDNFAYGPVNVPEPGTLFLLGTGLAALGLISRRRRL